MIFAAGFGRRMAPLTDTRPKPLIEVGGRTLLDHALAPALEAGLAPICVNAHYRADQIEAALAGSPARVLREAPDILETGGGLKAALPHLPGDAVFTMNSDAVWDGPNPFEVLRTAWRGDVDALLLCVPLDRALGRDDAGDFEITEGQFRRGAGFVYTGAQIIRRAPIAAHPERVFSFNVIWDALIAGGRIGACLYHGRWCDVGRPSSLALEEAMRDV
ncbi:MAG: nucleotidyltransferase family protein [Pseudomonadota bacterium]